jgi:hypothetical protein
MLLLAAASPAPALDIKLDIDSRRIGSSDTSGVITTQSGFTSWDLTNIPTGGTSTTVDSITFEIFGLVGGNQSRTRGTGGGGGGTLNNALTDFVFSEGAQGRFVGLRISNLPVGVYALQSWHYDSLPVVISRENFTQVDVQTQNVAGSAVTYADMAPFSTTALQYLLHVSSPGEVKEVIFREDDAPTVTDPLDENRSRLNAFTLRSLSELTLEINTTTGAMRIVNNESTNFDLKFYEIRSLAGSLKPDSWLSLDDTDASPDIAGLGWDESPHIGPKLLNEVRLQQTNTLAPGKFEALGEAFNTANPRDVLFFYGGPGDATLRMGAVQYVSGASALAGDYNDDGIVDGADYVLWRKGGPLANEGRSTGVTDQADYHFWRLRYGASTAVPSGTALRNESVPEPGYGLLLTGLIIFRRRRPPLFV